MPSIFSRKPKQPVPPDPRSATFPQSTAPPIGELERLISGNGDENGHGSTGGSDASNLNGRTRRQSRDKTGDQRERRGAGDGMGGLREGEGQVDRDRRMSGPSKVQFASSTGNQYPDLSTPTRATATATTSISSSRTARASPSGRTGPTPQSILKYPQVQDDNRPENRHSSEERYTFLPTRFPLLARAPPDPYLETTLVSSHGPRSSTHRYPAHPSGTAPFSSSSSAGTAGGGGRNLAPSGSWVGVIKDDARNGGMKYGYLHVEVGLVVGLHEMIGAVEVCVKELTDRGLTTPRLFSSKALDLSSNRITLLIQSYIRTLSHTRSSRTSAAGRDSPGRGGNTATATWQRDMQLASSNEVAWFLRWVLGRAVRIKLERVDVGWDGAGAGNAKDKRAVGDEPEWVEREERGLMNWEDYEIWRGRERASEYDKTYFQSFLRCIPPSLTFVIQPLFTLFSHFAAYSHESGMTPGAISALFGPLLFGCGPPSCSFDQAHAAFVRSAGATEHLILAYIRHQAATHDRLKGQFPGNLTNWVKGYPRMLITDRELDLGLPRKGLRVLKVERARRMVRAYTPDLYRSGQTWAAEMLRERNEPWPAWERTKISEVDPRQRNPYLPDVSDDALKNAPVLTEDHKKRMNVDGPVLPPRSSGSALSSSTMSSDTSIGTLSILTPQLEPSGSDFFASTIDRDWRIFEGKGFDDGGHVSEKLNFDLLQSVRQDTLNAKRRTMTWDDFAAPAGGFNRNAGGLDATLTLSPPVRTQIESWPEEREELHRKLRKSHKETQAKFQGWDTSPTVVPPGEGTEVIEEAFVDVAIDLLLSGGWTDYQELTHRPASWALMEYKTLPSQPSATDGLRGDPRTSSKLFLFEEFVPETYQRDLIAPEPKRAGFFSRNRGPKKSSHESAGPGRTMRTRDEAEFDAAIRRAVDTRMVALSKPVSYISSAPPDRLSSSGAQDSPTKIRFSRKSGAGDPPKSPHAANAATSTPNRPRIMGRISGRQGRSRSNIADERLMEETIETRTTSEESSAEGSHGRREPKPDVDKWIDILVASGAKRMDTQATPMSTTKTRSPRVPLNRSASASSMVRQPAPDFVIPLGVAVSPTPMPITGHDSSPALRRYGSEKSSLRQPMFASSLALDKVSPPLERLGRDQVIEPSTPEAEHPEQYAYAYSPEASRAVPEMQAVRDRSQTIEKVLDEDAFHQPAGSIHSQSALEILNAVGGDRSVHVSLDSPLPQSSPGPIQPKVSPLEEAAPARSAPPMLGAPIPVSPRALPTPPVATSALQHEQDNMDAARASSKRDTVHSIMDRYGAASPYGGHGRSNSEDLPPVPALPLSGHAVLRQLRPGFMRPDVPSQHESYASRDSYVSATDDAPVVPSTDRQRPGDMGGDYVPGLFARDEYEYEDSPVDPAYAPSAPASPIRAGRDGGEAAAEENLTGIGTARTQHGGAPWAALKTAAGPPKHVAPTSPGPPKQTAPTHPMSAGGAYPKLANFQPKGSPPRGGVGRVGTLASRFENAGRVPPPPKRHDDVGSNANVSDYRTALEEPITMAHQRVSDAGHRDDALQPPADHYHFEPPPTLADIEAIARRPSPGRVEHGMNLGFVPEEDEEYEEEDQVGGRPVIHEESLSGRPSEDALGLRDTGAKEIGGGSKYTTGAWEVEKMGTPDRKLRRR